MTTVVGHLVLNYGCQQVFLPMQLDQACRSWAYREDVVNELQDVEENGTDYWSRDLHLGLTKATSQELPPCPAIVTGNAMCA